MVVKRRRDNEEIDLDLDNEDDLDIVVVDSPDDDDDEDESEAFPDFGEEQEDGDFLGGLEELGEFKGFGETVEDEEVAGIPEEIVVQPEMRTIDVPDTKPKKKTASTVRQETLDKRKADKVFPSRLKMVLRKLEPNGRIKYIGSYAMSEVFQSASIEEFIHMNVIPEFGYGRYRLWQLDSTGTETNKGTLFFEVPNSEKGKGDEEMADLTTVITSLIEANKDSERRAEKRMDDMTRNNEDFLRGLSDTLTKAATVAQPVQPVQPVASSASTSPLDKIVEFQMNKLMLEQVKGLGGGSASESQTISPALEGILTKISDAVSGLAKRVSEVESRPRSTAQVLDPFAGISATPPPSDAVTMKDLVGLISSLKDMFSNNQPSISDIAGILQANGNAASNPAEIYKLLQENNDRMMQHMDRVMGGVTSGGGIGESLATLRELQGFVKDELAPKPEPEEGIGGFFRQLIESAPEILSMIRGTEVNTSALPAIEGAAPPPPNMELDDAIAYVAKLPDDKIAPAVSEIVQSFASDPIAGAQIRTILDIPDEKERGKQMLETLQTLLQAFVNKKVLTEASSSRILNAVMRDGVNIRM